MNKRLFFIKTKWFYLFLLFLAFSVTTQGQSCKSVLDKCPEVDEFFNKKAMSRYYKLIPGRKVRIYYVLYAGRGYNFNLCFDKSIGEINVKLLDPSTNVVYWDNADHNFEKNLSTSFGATKRVMLEIKVVDPNKININNSCLGIEVWYHEEEEVQLPGNPPGLPLE